MYHNRNLHLTSLLTCVSGIFGRRKRYLDSVDIECMNRCDNDCWKLMTNDNSVMLTNGKLLINFSNGLIFILCHHICFPACESLHQMGHEFQSNTILSCMSTFGENGRIHSSECPLLAVSINDISVLICETSSWYIYSSGDLSWQYLLSLFM